MYFYFALLPTLSQMNKNMGNYKLILKNGFYIKLIYIFTQFGLTY